MSQKSAIIDKLRSSNLRPTRQRVLIAEYLFNRGTQRDRQTAMSLNKKIKSNGVPRDIKGFVRRFMKTHGIDELKVYGRKSKGP